MKNPVMTIHWLRVFTVMVPVPLLWLMVVGSPLTRTLWVLLAIATFSILAGAFRIGGGRQTRSMADVIDDVDAEAPPLVVRATSAVSTPRKDGGRR